MPYAIGMVLNKTTNSHLELNYFECYSNLSGDGLLVYDSDSTTLNLTVVKRCSNGISIVGSTNVKVLYLMAQYNGQCGARVDSSVNISLRDVSATMNGEVGIMVRESHNATVSDANCSYCGWNGVVVELSNFTVLHSISAHHSGVFGAYIALCNHTTIAYSSFSHTVKFCGIYLISVAYTTISNTVASNNNNYVSTVC